MDQPSRLPDLYTYWAGLSDFKAFYLDPAPGNFTRDPRIRIELEQKELWQQFCALGTEMVITKPGRRMFPSYKIKIRGLEEKRDYVLMMDMAPASEHRYKYQHNKWVVAGRSEPTQYSPRTYVHPDSPAQGSHWLGQSISFHKLKLTNNVMARTGGQVVLNSMHKYVPRLHVLTTAIEDDVGSESRGRWSHVASFTFPQTVFIAVTAYQNEDITKLKIENNPFAKGFRDCEQMRRDKKISQSCKRLDSSDNSDEDESTKRVKGNPISTDNEKPSIKEADKSSDIDTHRLTSDENRSEKTCSNQLSKLDVRQSYSLGVCQCYFCRSPFPQHPSPAHQNLVSSPPFINPLFTSPNTLYHNSNFALQPTYVYNAYQHPFVYQGHTMSPFHSHPLNNYNVRSSAFW